MFWEEPEKKKKNFTFISRYVPFNETKALNMGDGNVGQVQQKVAFLPGDYTDAPRNNLQSPHFLLGILNFL